MESKENLARRVNCYKLLSLCYFQPGDNLLEVLTTLKGQQMSQDYASLVDNMITDFNKTKEAPNYLLIDYAKLFVGPFDVLAPPYGSIYLDNDRKIMGESTQDASNIYKRAGINIAQSFKDAPDHIAVELEFLYFVLFNYLNTGQSSYYQLFEEFLTSHLGKWHKQFTDNVLKNANTNFYKSLAHLTRMFIDNELVKVRRDILV